MCGRFALRGPMSMLIRQVRSMTPTNPRHVGSFSSSNGLTRFGESIALITPSIAGRGGNDVMGRRPGRFLIQPRIILAPILQVHDAPMVAVSLRPRLATKHPAPLRVVRGFFCCVRPPVTYAFIDAPTLSPTAPALPSIGLGPFLSGYVSLRARRGLGIRSSPPGSFRCRQMQTIVNYQDVLIAAAIIAVLWIVVVKTGSARRL